MGERDVHPSAKSGQRSHEDRAKTPDTEQVADAGADGDFQLAKKRRDYEESRPDD